MLAPPASIRSVSETESGGILRALDGRRESHKPKGLAVIPANPLSFGIILNLLGWLRGKDLNLRPLGYEPNELPDCSTPRGDSNKRVKTKSRNRRAQMWFGSVDIGFGLGWEGWVRRGRHGGRET